MTRQAWGGDASGAGIASVTAMRTPPRTAAVENAGPVPTQPASAPTTGPNSAPPTAAPMAVPSSWPRRSGGALVASQASPAAQVHAPARPWTNRAPSSAAAVSTQPKTRVDTLIRARPSSVTVR